MDNLLFITTVYRTGEKVYPVIKPLCSHFQVDVLNVHQMSGKTAWIGEHDPRKQFYKDCELYGAKVFHGPPATPDKDADSIIYYKYFAKLDKVLGKKYRVAIIDNNITIKGGQTSEIYNYLHKQGAVVVGCPHGNREYKGYRIHKRIGRMYDYSFVFGQKEKKQLSSINRKSAKKLICGGIPSNDKLANYQRKNKYILVLPNMIDQEHVYGPVEGFVAFSRKEFELLGIMSLSEKYNMPIIIKEKNKMYSRSSKLRDSMKDYPVKFIMDAKDDNELIANAFCVISAPSTMAFKPIQMGIPTVVLKEHGMIGNLYDCPGLVDRSAKQVRRSIASQIDQGKLTNFISNTLEGGLDFSSTEIYTREILNRFNT